MLIAYRLSLVGISGPALKTLTVLMLGEEDMSLWALGLVSVVFGKPGLVGRTLLEERVGRMLSHERIVWLGFRHHLLLLSRDTGEWRAGSSWWLGCSVHGRNVLFSRVLRDLSWVIYIVDIVDLGGVGASVLADDLGDSILFRGRTEARI